VFTTWFGPIRVSENEHGRAVVKVVPLFVGGPNSTSLQPLDHRFRIDYAAYFQAMAQARSTGQPTPSLVALPVEAVK
jgi:hypothetical protein